MNQPDGKGHIEQGIIGWKYVHPFSEIFLCAIKKDIQTHPWEQLEPGIAAITCNLTEQVQTILEK